MTNMTCHFFTASNLKTSKQTLLFAQCYNSGNDAGILLEIVTLFACSVEWVDIWNGREVKGGQSNVRILPCRSSHSGRYHFFTASNIKTSKNNLFSAMYLKVSQRFCGGTGWGYGAVGIKWLEILKSLVCSIDFGVLNFLVNLMFTVKYSSVSASEFSCINYNTSLCTV